MNSTTDEKEPKTGATLLARAASFTEDLSAASASEELVRRLVAMVEELFPKCPIFLGIEQGKAVEVVAATGPLSAIYGKFFSAAKVRKHLISSRRASRVVREFDKLAPFAPLGSGCRGVLVIPLRAFSREVGVLWIELEKPEEAAEEKIELVRLVAGQFATAYLNLSLAQEAGYLKGYLQGLFDHTNAGILVLNAKRKVKMANRVMENLLGRSADQMVGADFFDFVVVDERYEGWKTAFERALEGHPVSGESMDVVSRQGAVRHLVVNVARIPRAGNEGSGDVLFIALDVTETVGLREKMLQTQRLASLGQMTAGIAHQFNSPLQVIGAAADLLLEGAERVGLPAEELRSSAASLRDSLGRVQGLARNLLSFARPGGMKEEKELLDLNEEIERALSFSKFDLSRGGVKVGAAFSPDLPRIAGVADQLQHVFVNLFTNARQAMGPKGGEIRVQTRCAPDGRVEVEVSDDGPGVPKGLLKRIFEPFVTSKAEGSGLGLYVVRTVVERHGGSVDVHSSEEGTTFTLRFPAAEE